jgi:hypothetical protein
MTEEITKEEIQEKVKLIGQLFENLTKISDIAHKLEDVRFEAIGSALAVLIYNNQQDVITQIFEYFGNEIIPKMEQPRSPEYMTIN